MNAHPFSLHIAGFSNLIVCDGAQSADLEQPVYEHGFKVPLGSVDVYYPDVHVVNTILLLVQALLLCPNISILQA